MFEVANNGTIFLDEIAELPMNAQVKLLRVIQEGEIEKLGRTATSSVDVRIIAATNKNLAEEVRSGRFREDLYYRLNVFPLCIPSLRERRADIESITLHLIEKWKGLNDIGVNSIEEDALKVMCSYDWPGNVRELENVIQRAIILAENTFIDSDSLCFDHKINNSTEKLSINSNGVDIKDNEFKFILSTLKAVKGNGKRAPRKLGVSEGTLGTKMPKSREPGLVIPAGNNSGDNKVIT